MAASAKDSSTHIGTLNEKPLHAALKTILATSSDRVETKVDDYIVDILRDDLIIEIQTKNFSMIRTKLNTLVDQYRVRLVYPIPKEKWILKVDEDGISQQGRRKSPKRGSYADIFTELVSFPSLVQKPNFSLEVFLIQEEEIRKHDPDRAWRRKGWVTQERRLINIIDRRLFQKPEDFVALLPSTIQGDFTTTDLSSALSNKRRLAGQMAYCLREMGALTVVGKRGRAFIYRRD
jgi:hypothetical protein